MAFLTLYRLLLAAQPRLPHHEPGIHSLWEWIEEHGVIVYPSIVLLVILLIVTTMMQPGAR